MEAGDGRYHGGLGQGRLLRLLNARDVADDNALAPDRLCTVSRPRLGPGHFAVIAPLIPPRPRPGGREHGRAGTGRPLPVAALALAASAFIFAPSAFAGTKPPAQTCMTTTVTTYKLVTTTSYKTVTTVTHKVVRGRRVEVVTTTRVPVITTTKVPVVTKTKVCTPVVTPTPTAAPTPTPDAHTHPGRRVLLRGPREPGTDQ